MGKGQACDVSEDTYDSSLGRKSLNRWLFVTALMHTLARTCVQHRMESARLQIKIYVGRGMIPFNSVWPAPTLDCPVRKPTIIRV